MSHVTDLDLHIGEENLDELEVAAQKLGLVFMRDQHTYKWYGRFMNDSNAYGGYSPSEFGKSLHALRSKDYQPGDYEIGVVKSKTGPGYNLLLDTWGPGQKLIRQAGPGLGRLRQEYAAAVAEKNSTKLRRAGYHTEREVLSNGTLRLHFRKR